MIARRRQREGAAPNTIRLMRNALSASLNVAIRREQLPPWANVAARAQAPKVHEEAPRFIPPHLVGVLSPGFGASRTGSRS